MFSNIFECWRFLKPHYVCLLASHSDVLLVPRNRTLRNALFLKIFLQVCNQWSLSQNHIFKWDGQHMLHITTNKFYSTKLHFVIGHLGWRGSAPRNLISIRSDCQKRGASLRLVCFMLDWPNLSTPSCRGNIGDPDIPQTLHQGKRPGIRPLTDNSQPNKLSGQWLASDQNNPWVLWI